MSEKDNIRVGEEYGEALNAHDYARMSDCHGEGFQCQGPAAPEPLGEAAYQADWQRLWTAYPDMTVEARQMIAQGDYVVVNWTLTGTHDGPLSMPTGETVPATGRKFTLPGSSTLEFKNGKIMRQHEYWDQMTVLAQLGLVPGA